MPKFSIGLLLYGQQVQLHQRCVESVSQLLLSDRLDLVCDVRIGLNNTHPAAVRFAVELSRKTGKRVLAYTPQWPSGSPAYKYPVLRKMLFDTADPVADWVLWFDDDSFVRPTPGWLERAAERTEERDVLGYLRRKQLNGDQELWLPRQPWYRPEVGLPPLDAEGRRTVSFAQGGLLAWRTALSHRYGWPWPELRHCGGDSWLGELCRQQGLRIGPLPEGGVPNAAFDGTPDRSRRRGYTEPELGAVLEPPTYHQHWFWCLKVIYHHGKAERTMLPPDQYGSNSQASRD